VKSLFGQSAILVDEPALDAWYVAPCIDWVQSELAKDTELDGALVVVQCRASLVPKRESREPQFYTLKHYRVIISHNLKCGSSEVPLPVHLRGTS
jgi:hypothetical protein